MVHCLNILYTYDSYHPGEINVTNDNTKKRSGSVELLYEDEWTEVKKTGRGQEKDVELELTVPKDGHFQIRFPKEDRGKRLRIFIENVEGQDGNADHN